MNQGFVSSALKASLLVSAVLLCGSVTRAWADAEAPTLKFSGFTIAAISGVKQEDDSNGRNDGYNFQIPVSDLNWDIIGKSASGMTYKYHITFEAIPGDWDVAQNYVEFDGSAGTVQFGNVVGPEDSMIKDASAVTGGAGGFDAGSYADSFNVSAGVLKGNDVIGDTDNATKIVYYSPEFYGFKVGVAFTPNTAHRGKGKANNLNPKADDANGNGALYPGKRTSQPFGRNNISIGLAWSRVWKDWKVDLTGAFITDKSYLTTDLVFDPVVGAFADARGTRYNLRNVKAYQLGGVVGYKGWQFGAGWLDSGNSRLPMQADLPLVAPTAAPGTTGNMHLGTSGQAWNIGAGYSFGIYKIGASYQDFSRKTDAVNKASSKVVTLTADMTPMQGLKFYAEADYVVQKTNAPAVANAQTLVTRGAGGAAGNGYAGSAIGNNSGPVLMVGAKLSF